MVYKGSGFIICDRLYLEKEKKYMYEDKNFIMMYLIRNIENFVQWPE